MEDGCYYVRVGTWIQMEEGYFVVCVGAGRFLQGGYSCDEEA